MHFGKKKSQNQSETTHWDRVAAALEGVERASRTAKATTDYAAGRQAWIAALLPHFEALGVAVPYFQSLTLLLAGLANSQRGERLELVNRTRRAVAEATEHMQALARSAEAKGASKASKAKGEPSKRSAYVRLAKAMTVPALKAQIESHRALLKTAEETPETAGARREIKSELAAFEREAAKRGGAPKAPKAPKKEPKTSKAKRTPKEKKLKKPEMAARLLAHHAREKGEKKAKREKNEKKPKGPKAKKEGETTNELLARLGFTKELTKDVPGSFGGGAHVFKDGKKLFTGTSLQVHAWLKKQADKL